ncbi:hypothetical protein ACHAW5_010762, partial [Stephanodiscus triporus]
VLPPPPPPPSLLSWCVASSAASAISYADRGTSAVASSQLLHELGWTEGQLGGVQGSFYAGYALTQVLGGLLGGGRGGLRGRGRGRRRRGRDGAIDAEEGSSSSSSRNDGEEDDEEGSDGAVRLDGGVEEEDEEPVVGYYRSILPLSLALTAISTLLFPLSAERGGPALASFDRFCLGLFEGLLLPAAMAGVSDVAAASATTKTKTKSSEEEEGGDGGGRDGDPRNDGRETNVATASSAVIAGCYLGSAWAYLSAWVLFSERFQAIASDWTIGWGGRHHHHAASVVAAGVHPVVWPFVFYLNGIVSLVCLFRVGAPPSASDAVVLDPPSPPPSSTASSSSDVAAAAGVAASSLILPQVTQALVGVTIGLAADKLSSRIGTRTTRRALQLAGGVIPAALLWYLSLGDGGDNSRDGDALASPAFLFGTAQTVSALSLGAVSVSHLDVASPSSAGAVYALGNVAAATSGSIVVNLFGRLLEDEDHHGAGKEAGPCDNGGGDEFALPFRVIAILSAVGSLVYGCTVETELEIGFNETTS